MKEPRKNGRPNSFEEKKIERPVRTGGRLNA
jgi:hypothetical protein